MVLSIPIDINGVKFKSISEASRFYKIDPRVVSYRLNKGFSLAQAFGLEQLPAKTAPKKITVKGKTYKSVSDAARAHNIRPGTLQARLKEYNFKIEEALELVPRKDYVKNRFGRVYVISNKFNKKVYVGVTLGSLENRLSRHIDAAYKKKKIRVGSLYDAIIKLGPKSFTIKEIDQAINLGELSLKERRWIKNYKSVIPNGYNIVSGGGAGSQRGKKIIVKGKKFKSIIEACNYYGLKSEAQRREISDRISKRGWTPEEAFNLKKKEGYVPKARKKFKIQGKEFDGYGEAKRYFKTKASISLISSRIRIWGWTLEEALEIKERKHPQFKELTYKGKKYENMKSLCDDYKFNYKLFKLRFSKGWSIEKSLEKKNNNFNEVVFKDKKYKNEKELCEAYGIKYKTFRARRYSYGWSLEDSLFK
ncbi:GIY-YIG nuclease family protein [Candidatus Pelagibacter ubique]|nr:GIY-YIG nuclease family protein [Candidatus Pelagibacter ubique]